jgi:uncharacterized protein YjiK
MMMKALFFLLTLFLLAGCWIQTEKVMEDYSLPKGYSLASVEKINLGKDLYEISGIAWDKGKIMAIEDESAAIFQLDPETGKILQKQKFHKNQDIEDILIKNDTAWVLRSNGNIYQVSHFLSDTFQTLIVDFPQKQSRDLEAIASPTDEPVIWFFCKDCKWDAGSEQFSVFRFSIESMEFDKNPYHIIHNSALKEFLPEKWEKIKMRPSAAAYHPMTQELYLISSSGKWLMTLDQNWNPTSFHLLNATLFKQPEGMTFDEQGNLYISNEGASGSANLLFFPYER